ncbi:MAG: rod shape-determining protein MreC [Opitutae bacterium]|nr:rod shape-determining protein MreC [Opitutae bacterium]
MLPAVFKSFVRVSFFELEAPVEVATSYARDLQEYWALRMHSNEALVEAGRDLARLNAAYELRIQENTALRGEIERLDALMRLPTFIDYRSEPARVVRRDFSGWWQRLIIRKGQNFRITVGAPVVFTGGVVGRITEVRATTAVVELISSQNVRLAAVIEGDTRPISFQGGLNTSFAPPKGVVEFMPLDIFARPNARKRLVTSGLGGVFPPGLTLGYVTHSELGADGLYQTGVVELDPRLSSLTEVTVLVPLNPD